MKIYVFASAEKAPDFISSSIMRALGTRYSHVALIISNLELVNYENTLQSAGGFRPEKPYVVIYQADGAGVNVANAQSFFETHSLEYLLDVTEYIGRQEYSIGWLDAKIGLLYSNAQYLGFLGKLLKPFGNNNNQRYICSELVAEFLNACSSIRLFDKHDCDFVSPKQIVEGLRLVRAQKGKS